MIVKSSRNLCLKLYGKVQFIVTQNIDGLHLRSGVPRRNIAELHGNMFTAQCDKCKRMFVRGSPAPTVGQKYVGEDCPAVSNSFLSSLTSSANDPSAAISFHNLMEKTPTTRAFSWLKVPTY